MEDLCSKSTFMDMRRGHSVSWTHGDYWHKLNENYDRCDGDDRTGGFNSWEEAITKCTVPFVLPMGMHIIYDDYFETQADLGAIAI